MKQLTPVHKTVLRLATMEDVPALVPHLESFHRESPYKNVPFDAEKVFRLAASFMLGDADKVMIVLDYEGTIIGFVAGQTSEVVFGRAKIASELAWYVVEGFRSGSGAMRLRQAFEYWAENIAKADIIHMASLAGAYAEKLDKHYTKKGYKLYEMTYLKDTGNGRSI